MDIDRNKKDGMAEWSQVYGRQITEEEYREISSNLYDFFTLLHRWDKEDKQKKET